MATIVLALGNRKAEADWREASHVAAVLNLIIVIFYKASNIVRRDTSDTTIEAAISICQNIEGQVNIFLKWMTEKLWTLGVHFL